MLRKLTGGGAEKADVATGDGPLATLLEEVFAFERHLVGRGGSPGGRRGGRAALRPAEV
jgi:hypothetical protein